MFDSRNQTALWVPYKNSWYDFKKKTPILKNYYLINNYVCNKTILLNSWITFKIWQYQWHTSLNLASCQRTLRKLCAVKELYCKIVFPAVFRHQLLWNYYNPGYTTTEIFLFIQLESRHHIHIKTDGSRLVLKGVVYSFKVHVHNIRVSWGLYMAFIL